MARHPLASPTTAERDRFNRNREAMHEAIWSRMPEIIDGAVELAIGVKVTVDGQQVYQQTPDLEAIKFLTERVDGKPRQEHGISGGMTVNHNYDALLDRLVGDRMKSIRDMPALDAPQVVEGTIVSAQNLPRDVSGGVSSRTGDLQDARESILAAVMGLDTQNDPDLAPQDDQNGGMTDLFSSWEAQNGVQAVHEEEEGREGGEKGQVDAPMAEEEVTIHFDDSLP